VVYFGLYDPRDAPGVHKKIVGTLAAAAAAGYGTRLSAEPFVGGAPLGRLFMAIVRSDETHLILRSLGWANLFLVPALCLARLRGQRVVIEVPTPHRIGVREVSMSDQSRWRRVRTVALLYASGPWSLWPASRIIQYADEGPWFRFGNRRRTVKIGNGVDVGSTPQRRSAPEWPAPVLQLLGVATLMSWHGYDRLIRAIAELHANPARRFDAHFTIVGDGPALADLVRLTDELGLRDHVTFTGPLAAEDVRAHYERAHLGVSALAIHRKGLHEAAALKAREYCAVGLPFIAAGHDPDFAPDLPFRIEVESSEDTATIVAALEDVGRRRALFADDDVRRYAVERLDFAHKLESLIP
jgi:glycosyltransferase involved in cell wall biosynthesis